MEIMDICYTFVQMYKMTILTQYVLWALGDDEVTI